MRSSDICDFDGGSFESILWVKLSGIFDLIRGVGGEEYQPVRLDIRPFYPSVEYYLIGMYLFG